MNRKIMLFDEVTASLDPEMVREVLDVILELAKQGMTMVIVTHEMSFAHAVADRIVFMNEGKICEVSKPDEFFTALALGTLVLGSLAGCSNSNSTASNSTCCYKR